jgi:integrase
MTASDVTSVIDAALEESELAGLCLRLAATTGMRRGELVGLRWADLDGEILTVARSVTAARNGTGARAPVTLNIGPRRALVGAVRAPERLPARAVGLRTARGRGIHRARVDSLASQPR